MEMPEARPNRAPNLMPDMNDFFVTRSDRESAQKSPSGDKCLQRGRLEAGKRPRRAAEWPKRTAMPPRRGHGDLA